MKLKYNVAVANWLKKSPACPSLREMLFHQKGVTPAEKLIYVMPYREEQLQCLENVIFILILCIKSVGSSLFC